MKLIDKSAIVAEIQRRISILEGNGILASNVLAKEYRDILSFIDSLEVKEVKEEPVSKDLKKEVDSQMDLTRRIDIEQVATKIFPLPILYNEEQQKSKEYAEVYQIAKDQQFGFIRGALWADEHPIHYDGKAMLHVLNKGYKDAIEKACEFFENRMWRMKAPMGKDYVVDGEASSISEFIRNFKDYMEEKQ